MLTAKTVMPDGVVVATEEGTPQGGPLTPHTEVKTFHGGPAFRAQSFVAGLQTGGRGESEPNSVLDRRSVY